MSGMSRNGPRSALMYSGPPMQFTGKTFTAVAPRSKAFCTSVGVSAPGIIGMPAVFEKRMISFRVFGVTMNSAPAARAFFRSLSWRTVPAPTVMPNGFAACLRHAIIASASSVFMVTSIAFRPHAAAVFAQASSAPRGMSRRIPMTGTGFINSRKSMLLV